MALLLWGLRLVRTGVTDGWGSDIQKRLGASLEHRGKAFTTGLGVTLLMQSSSATALLTASFSGQGLLTATTALAILLGADIGTTVVAQILSFDLSALSPVLVALGVALFSYSNAGRRRDLGRVLLGIGLMLLALKLIVAASLPMRESIVIQQIFAALGSDLILAVVFAAAIAWASHSSLATVLLVMALASSGAIDMPVAFAFVLGANIGGALVPCIATLGANRDARLPPLGNLVFRSTGVILVLPLIDPLASQISPLEIATAQQIAGFHMLFNLLLALFAFPLIDRVVAFCSRLLPPDPENVAQQHPRHLDRAAFETPLAALVNAEREVLRMGEIVETMLRNAFVALERNDFELARESRELDHVVNRFYDLIKLYLTALAREPLGEEEFRRLNQILAFATELEHVGDVVSGNLIENILRKKLVTKASLSESDREALDGLYQPVLQAFQLSFSVFTSGDVAMARQLLAHKYKFVKRERRAVQEHLEKIRRQSSYDSRLSALQLDLLRDLKRINSHLTSVAYPILDQAGHLRSRLRGKKPKPVRDRVLQPAKASPST